MFRIDDNNNNKEMFLEQQIIMCDPGHMGTFFKIEVYM